MCWMWGAVIRNWAPMDWRFSWRLSPTHTHVYICPPTVLKHQKNQCRIHNRGSRTPKRTSVGYMTEVLKTSKEPVSDSWPGFSKHLRTGQTACYETVGLDASCLVRTVGSFKGAEITGTGGFFLNFARTDGSLIWNFLFRGPEPGGIRV
jgi:hypothetical protein